MRLSPLAFFSALAHETRLRCLLLLLEYQELCVCELTHAIGAAQPHMSRHLAQLRELGLVVDRRDGLWVYYRVNPSLPKWAAKVLRDSWRGVGDQEPFKRDIASLAQPPDRVVKPRCA